MQVTATGTDGDDAAIFVYQWRNTTNTDGEFVFTNVASLQDMNTIPVAEAPVPADGGGWQDSIPFMRTTEVTLDHYNLNDLEVTWHWMKQQVADLRKEYRAARKLAGVEEVVYE